MAIFANNSFAQSDSKDYSLERLSKTFSEIDSKFSFMVHSSFKNGKLIITIERLPCGHRDKYFFALNRVKKCLQPTLVQLTN